MAKNLKVERPRTISTVSLLVSIVQVWRHLRKLPPAHKKTRAGLMWVGSSAGKIAQQATSHGSNPDGCGSDRSDTKVMVLRSASEGRNRVDRDYDPTAA
jgi:hypothetical protein